MISALHDGLRAALSSTPTRLAWMRNFMSYVGAPSGVYGPDDGGAPRKSLLRVAMTARSTPYAARGRVPYMRDGWRMPCWGGGYVRPARGGARACVRISRRLSGPKAAQLNSAPAPRERSSG
eukprot:6853425-Prymnesium_polylepis.1